jgi:hypothetical protein
VHERQIRLAVAAIGGAAALKLQPAQVSGTRSARLTVDISQGGNAPVDVVMSAEDPAGLLSFHFAPPRLTVPPLGSARATCTISGRPSSFGDVQTYPFTVHATGFQGPLEAAGTFYQLPRIGRRQLRIIAITLTAIGAALALLGAFLLPWANAWGGPDGPTLRGYNWDWEHLLQSLYTSTNIGEGFLKSPWLSGGSIVALLAVVALVAAILGRARLARIAAALIIAAMVALLLALMLHAGLNMRLSSGIFVVLIGGILALAGGLFVRPVGRDMGMPKTGGMPKAPQTPPAPRMPNIRH